MAVDDAEVAQLIQNGNPTEHRSPSAVVSVVVPCCGQLEFTRLCVPSLLRHSRQPYELVFVDLESMDGTADYLAGILAAANVPVHLLRLAGDAGFAEALNKGIAHATGAYVVLLNNDTIVTSNWLEHLVALADSSHAIGLVGAMSNCADGPQSVGPVPYRVTTRSDSLNPPGIVDGQPTIDTEPVHQFARQWTEENRGQWFEADRLATFCLMFKRHVLDQVLPLQPQTFFSFNSDAVFRKIHDCGYTIACCRDLFIHNFATRPTNRSLQ